MRIKSYQQFEGLGSYVRRKFNKDEVTAEGIFKKISGLKKEDITTSDDIDMLHDEYEFTIDDFNIRANSVYSMQGGRDYSIDIDNFKIDASNTICKKIYKMVDDIYKKDINSRISSQKEEGEFIKKDARIHFSDK